MDNYRPIALASILSKVLEKILLHRLELYVSIADNQFGFKRKHGTDMCIYALKDIISNYRNHNSTMFLCFIDASRAFDRLNHFKLFTKLCHRGVPSYIIRILAYWYAHQTMQVRWGNTMSEHFHVGNGVRQGGILSPFLFNLYMDDLSRELNLCNTGCVIGSTVVNHLMYADDLVTFSPCSAGLQQLLRICSQYGTDFNIKYNAKKSSILIVRSKNDTRAVFPKFVLSGNELLVCKDIKYLGHYFSDDLSDDKDIHRQRCKLYAQANMLIRKFSKCSVDVKVSLFKAFCTPLYTAHLWSNYRCKSMEKLKVAYNDALRLLVRVPRWHSASQLFVNLRVPTCQALLRNLMYKFMCRLDKSENSVIVNLINPVMSFNRLSSKLWKHWRSSLYIL